MRYVSVCVVAAAVMLLWAGAARAERESEYLNPGPDRAPSPPKPSPPVIRPGMFAAGSVANVKRMSVEQREERRFLKEAAAASRFEIEASRLALTKSSNPGVRSYATALVEHHTSTGLTLQYMLHGRGMAPPMLDNDDRKTLNRLTKLTGKKFERVYMEEVGLKQYQEDLQLYEGASHGAGDPMLKTWIANTLPTLQQHLATAERIVAGQAKPIKPTAPQAAAQPGTRGQYMGAAPLRVDSKRPATPARPIGSNSP